MMEAWERKPPLLQSRRFMQILSIMSMLRKQPTHVPNLARQLLSASRV